MTYYFVVKFYINRDEHTQWLTITDRDSDSAPLEYEVALAAVDSIVKQHQNSGWSLMTAAIEMI